MDLSGFQACLKSTIEKWRRVKCRDMYEFSATCDQFSESKISATFLKTLGDEMFNKRRLSILDVGCGRSKTGSLLVGSAEIEKYHGIDYIDKSGEFLHNFQQKQIKELKFFQRDIYMDDLDDFEHDTYDIVIIDVEPHGKEIEIYQKIHHLMKPAHFCLLKHIGYIDLYSSAFADYFLDKHINSGNIFDYFAEAGLHIDTRDIFVIMSREETRLDAVCQRLARGEPTNWADPKHPKYVLRNHESRPY